MRREEHDGQDWSILRIDPISGDLLGEAELAFRAHIRAGAEQGLVGVDALYWPAQQAIHQPLIDEHGTVSGDSWLLKRANRTTLRVPVPGAAGAAGLERAAVTIARAVIDLPNWRRPDFTLRLSDLLDRPGFKRDSRGVHRSDARRSLTTTLLALHPTHVRWRDGGPGADWTLIPRPDRAVAPGRPNRGRRSPVVDLLPISTGHKGPRGHYRVAAIAQLSPVVSADLDRTSESMSGMALMSGPSAQRVPHENGEVEPDQQRRFSG
jgi:hypothetical protein